MLLKRQIVMSLSMQVGTTRTVYSYSNVSVVVTFMATQRMSDDSFLHDVQQEAAIEDGEWNENPRQRPSDIFIQRSRNMDHVEFTSPTHSQHIEKSTHDIWSMKTPASKKARSYELSIGPSEAVLY